MKKIHLLLVAVLSLVLGSCMDHHDEPGISVYGNKNIGSPNTSIADLKKRYVEVYSNSKVEKIEDNIIIEGVVVADDEAGNIYKSLYINDGTGVIIISVNTTGLYGFTPVGQKIAVDCKGLYIGGYGGLAQVGAINSGKIGRMPEFIWKDHVKSIDQPSPDYPELIPVEIDAAWLKSHSKDEAPYLVKLTGVTIAEADGELPYAPEDEADAGNGVNRTLKVEGTKLPFRISSYSNFAKEAMPYGKINLVGVLTRYNSDWQFTVRTNRDITPQTETNK